MAYDGFMKVESTNSPEGRWRGLARKERMRGKQDKEYENGENPSVDNRDEGELWRRGKSEDGEQIKRRGNKMGTETG